MGLSLTFGLIFLLSRVITIALNLASTHFELPAIATRPLLRAKKHHVVHRVVKPHKAATFVEVNLLHMNSSIQEYNVVFAGQVRCDGQPCTADLQFQCSSTRNDNVHRAFRTMDDGS